MRAAFKARGCLYIPKAIDAEEADRMRHAVESAHNYGCMNNTPSTEWNNPPKMRTSEDAFTLAAFRRWANAVGGSLAIDSPRGAFLILDMLKRHGIRDLVEEYLGEPPVLSASKFMLWRMPCEGPEGGASGRALSG